VILSQLLHLQSKKSPSLAFSVRFQVLTARCVSLICALYSGVDPQTIAMGTPAVDRRTFAVDPQTVAVDRRTVAVVPSMRTADVYVEEPTVILRT
jgi:hypothetical protein